MRLLAAVHPNLLPLLIIGLVTGDGDVVVAAAVRRGTGVDILDEMLLNVFNDKRCCVVLLLRLRREGWRKSLRLGSTTGGDALGLLVGAGDGGIGPSGFSSTIST